MVPRGELATVYTGWQIDALRARSALEGHGIRAEILGENSAATYSVGWGVRVVVRPCDAEAARDVLEESGLLEPS